MPAGFPANGADKQYHPSGKYGGDDLLDEEEGPSAYSFATPATGPYARRRTAGGRWRRFREDYLTDVDWTFGLNRLLGRKSKFEGVPRDVALNDPGSNKVKGYESNSVATGKYGPITFLPKFLFGQCSRPTSHLTLLTRTAEFSRSANLFFLFTACIQQVPNVSPTGRYTTIVPLAVVLVASAFKEIQEDIVSNPSGPAMCLTGLETPSIRQVTQ